MPQLPYDPTVRGGQPGSGAIGFQRIGGIDADAFGATQGRALVSFGQEMSRVFGALSDIQSRDQASLVESETVKQVNDFTAEMEQDLENRRRSATGDAAGFATSFMQSFNERRNKLLASIPDQVRREAVDARLAPTVRQFATRAFERQLQVQDAFETTDLDMRTSRTLNEIQRAGGADFDTRVARQIEVIQASRLPETVKQQRIASLREAAATAAALGIMQNDPASIAAATGGKTPFFQTLGDVESSNNPRAMAPTSSATGLYQFINSTWGVEGQVDRNGRPTGLANTPEGRAAGLRPIPRGGIRGPNDPRFDVDQQERAIRLFTAQNTRALTAAGIPVDSRNLYLAHFMGAQGAIDFIREMQRTPNDPASELFSDAAGANRRLFYRPDGSARTLREAYEVITRRFANAPAGDPGSVNPNIINNLPPNQFAQIRDRAEREANQQVVRVTAQQNAMRTEQENEALIAVINGQAGREALPGLIERGLFSDPGRRLYYENLVARQEAQGSAEREYAQSIGTPGSGLEKADRDRADVGFGIYQRQGLSPDNAARQAFLDTGVVPPAGVRALLAGLNSNDMNQVRAAYNAANQILMSGGRPDVLQGIPMGSELQERILEMRAIREAYPDASQADARMMELVRSRASPDWAAQKSYRDRVAATEIERIKTDQDTVLSELQRSLATGFSAGAGITEAVRPLDVAARGVLLADYQQLYLRGVERTGDPDAAKRYAQMMLRNTWGPTRDPNGGVRLTKWPIERSGMADPTNAQEPFAYIYRQAQAQLRAQGINVPLENIYFQALPQTGRQIREGLVPQYQVQFRREMPGLPGVMGFDIMPGTFSPDLPGHRKAVEAQRAVEIQQVIQGATPGSGRTSTPTTGRSAEAARQDERLSRQQMIDAGLVPLVGGQEQPGTPTPAPQRPAARAEELNRIGEDRRQFQENMQRPPQFIRRRTTEGF